MDPKNRWVVYRRNLSFMWRVHVSLEGSIYWNIVKTSCLAIVYQKIFKSGTSGFKHVLFFVFWRRVFCVVSVCFVLHPLLIDVEPKETNHDGVWKKVCLKNHERHTKGILFQDWSAFILSSQIWASRMSLVGPLHSDKNNRPEPRFPRSFGWFGVLCYLFLASTLLKPSRSVFKNNTPCNHICVSSF